MQARVDGAIETTGPGWIEGCVQGDLKTTGKLVIGKNARITGNVHAGGLVSHGRIYGNVFIAGKAVFCGRAFVKGDVNAMILDIEENVVIEGAITKNANAEASPDEEAGPLPNDNAVRRDEGAPVDPAGQGRPASPGGPTSPISPARPAGQASPRITILEEEANATTWF